MTNTKMNAVDKKIKEQSELKWIMNASWRKLTRAEKVARVALKTLRFVVIAAVVAVIACVVIGTIFGIVVAMGIISAITGGFECASRTNTNRLYGMYKW